MHLDVCTMRCSAPQSWITAGEAFVATITKIREASLRFFRLLSYNCCAHPRKSIRCVAAAFTPKPERMNATTLCYECNSKRGRNQAPTINSKKEVIEQPTDDNSQTQLDWTLVAKQRTYILPFDTFAFKARLVYSVALNKLLRPP